MLKQIIPMSDFDADAGAVVDALLKHPGCSGRVGAVGICLGGHLAFRAALLPEVRATVCCYPTDLHTGTLGKGGGADSLLRAKEIRGELLMVFGRQDPHVPLAGRAAIYHALDAAGCGSHGTSSTPRMRSCVTKANGMILPPRGWCSGWQPSCSPGRFREYADR